jgi:hypothetical protein
MSALAPRSPESRPSASSQERSFRFAPNAVVRHVVAAACKLSFVKRRSKSGDAAGRNGGPWRLPSVRHGRVGRDQRLPPHSANLRAYPAGLDAPLITHELPQDSYNRTNLARAALASAE